MLGWSEAAPEQASQGKRPGALAKSAAAAEKSEHCGYMGPRYTDSDMYVCTIKHARNVLNVPLVFLRE